MSVDDHGLEAIRKSAHQVTPGNKSEYYLLTKIADAVTGSFSPSGLSTAFRNSTFDISVVAIKLPPVALVGRNSMIIYNRSTTEILYIGNSDVTADVVDGTTSGWQIEPNSYFPIDITDDIVLYGIFATGTHKIQILELA